MDYVESASIGLLSTLMGVLRKTRPGHLESYVLRQDESGAWVSAEFTLERWPGVTYRLRRGLKDGAGATPKMEPESYVGVILGSIIEKTSKRPGAEQTQIDI